ncbi:MAG: hypothetical protein HRU70_03110 [Phycisphaeraceae bacterium]|nr:MAG: hypothetical protein HRU70_03110 [Phycisphaeraceae bacterium]
MFQRSDILPGIIIAAAIALIAYAAPTCYDPNYSWCTPFSECGVQAAQVRSCEDSWQSGTAYKGEDNYLHTRDRRCYVYTDHVKLLCSEAPPAGYFKLPNCQQGLYCCYARIDGAVIVTEPVNVAAPKGEIHGCFGWAPAPQQPI